MPDFEYDIYVPVFDNQGNRHDPQVLKKFKARLIEKFGGLTDTRYQNEGIWRTGTVLQKDEIVIWRALSVGDDVRDDMIQFKKEMAAALAQEEILIVRREVMTL